MNLRMYIPRSPHLLAVVLVMLFLPAREADSQVIDVCVKKSACSCENSKGTIDLSPLASSGGTPRFQDVQSQDAGGNQFSWNPCTPFTEGDGTCTNVASCQKQPGSPPAFFSIGTQDSAKFITAQDNTVTIQYSAKTDVKRTTVLKLMCDTSQPGDGTLEAAGEDPAKSAFYDLTYKGKYACPNAGPPPTTKPTPGPGGGGISIGSVLCIVVFSLLVVYVVAGILVQKFVRKASGKEMIPQYTLWTSVPGLIKAGTLFVVRRGKVSRGYDNI